MYCLVIILTDVTKTSDFFFQSPINTICRSITNKRKYYKFIFNQMYNTINLWLLFNILFKILK